MSSFWFKPKKYGYGASPVTREGWIATIAYGVLVFAVTLLCGVGSAPQGNGASLSVWIIWGVLMAVLTGGFIWVSRVKTDGDWRWRWGDET